jgi:DNA-binding HxlR family transcriptional regulator
LTTHTNIGDKKIPIPDNPKREKVVRITQDQKKIRILSYLQSKNEPVEKSTLLEKITKNTMSRSVENTAFLEKMKEDELITLKHNKGVSSRYEISEKGKDLIDLIKLIKKNYPKNPIWTVLDIFQMTKNEKWKIKRNNDGAEDFEKIFDYYETDENVEKIKERFGI